MSSHTPECFTRQKISSLHVARYHIISYKVTQKIDDKNVFGYLTLFFMAVDNVFLSHRVSRLIHFSLAEMQDFVALMDLVPSFMAFFKLSTANGPSTLLS